MKNVCQAVREELKEFVPSGIARSAFSACGETTNAGAGRRAAVAPCTILPFEPFSFDRPADGPDERQHFPLLRRKLSQGLAKILKVEVAFLVANDDEPPRIGAVAVLNLASAFAVVGIVDVAQDGEQPRAQARSRLEFVRLAPRPEQRLLDQSSASEADPDSEIANARKFTISATSSSLKLALGITAVLLLRRLQSSPQLEEFFRKRSGDQNRRNATSARVRSHPEPLDRARPPASRRPRR